MRVTTIKGELELSDLEVRDLVSYENTSRVIATEWYYKGELVRRDVWVSVLSGSVFTGAQGEIGGELGGQ